MEKLLNTNSPKWKWWTSILEKLICWHEYHHCDGKNSTASLWTASQSSHSPRWSWEKYDESQRGPFYGTNAFFPFSNLSSLKEQNRWRFHTPRGFWGSITQKYDFLRKYARWYFRWKPKGEQVTDFKVQVQISLHYKISIVARWVKYM